MVKKAKAPHCADTRAKEGERGFAGIPVCVVKSEAYRRLSLIARAILVEIVTRMKGHNNGAIHVSYAELAHSLNRKNQAPIGPAIAELMQHGLLDLSAASVWQERKAREYRLTFVNTTDDIGRPIRATNDYLKWHPEEKIDTTDVVAGKVKSATAFVAGKAAVATDAVAGTNGKLPKTLNGSATDGVVLISKPYAGPKKSGSETPDLDPQNVNGPDEPDCRPRNKIIRYYYALSPKRRRTWAGVHGVTPEDVQRYCVSDPDHLPAAKVAAMLCAIKNEKSEARQRERDRKRERAV